MNSAVPSNEPSRKNSQDLLRETFTEVKPLEELQAVRGDYTVHIPNFQGPLDLLLHLIRKEQVDIYDIPVSKICNSYFEQLEILQQFDVNLASEFMVMAATLIQLKSQFLLPKEETEEEEDPRLPLVQQLLEYERFKEAADTINQIDWLHRDVYPRPSAAVQQMIPKEALENAPVEPVDTFQLLVCLKTSLDRTERKPVEIAKPSASLQETLGKMSSELVESDTTSFTKLLPENCRKNQVVMAFLTMLELAKLKFIQILQHKNFGPIQIRKMRELKELDVSFLEQY